MEKDSRDIKVFMLVCSIVTCSIAIGTIIWQAGYQAACIRDHEKRLQAIELAGSVTLQKHVAEDNQREKRIDKMETALQQLVTSYADFKADLRQNSSKMDVLKEMLIAHSETTKGEK
jgi:hypothetical protein